MSGETTDDADEKDALQSQVTLGRFHHAHYVAAINLMRRMLALADDVDPYNAACERLGINNSPLPSTGFDRRPAAPPAALSESPKQPKMIEVNKWGMQLIDALGKFLEQVLASDRPLTTKIMCEFPGMPANPVMWLWATIDDQSPISRMSVICEERDAANAEVSRLAAEAERMKAKRDNLAALAKAVVLNARGRSGGSVYMINRAVWLPFRDAVAPSMFPARAVLAPKPEDRP